MLLTNRKSRCASSTAAIRLPSDASTSQPRIILIFSYLIFFLSLVNHHTTPQLHTHTHPACVYNPHVPPFLCLHVHPCMNYQPSFLSLGQFHSMPFPYCPVSLVPASFVALSVSKKWKVKLKFCLLPKASNTNLILRHTWVFKNDPHLVLGLW